MEQRLRWLNAILAVALVFVAACGSGDDATDPGDAGSADALDVGGGDATPGDGGDEDTAPDVEEDTAPDVEDDTTPDVVEDVTPDADVVEDVTPDADVVEDVTPDADVVEDVTPDADVVEDVTPDADVTPDSDATTECEDGFELVDGECVNIDECATDADNCDENATCRDTEGGFECTCNDDWFGDGVICVENPCVIYEPGSFERPDDSPETVDCIAPSVCLARGAGGPLFNSLVETADEAPGCGEPGPSGTEWAVGACEGNEGPFTGFVDMTGCSPRSIIGQTVCLHVIEEDLFFNARFTSFTGGGRGGGFAYDRVLVGGGVCGLGTTCSFDVETAEATCTCIEGLTGDGCVDIDECAEGLDDCGDAICENTYGGFDCVCPPGSEFDRDLVCVDIDECAEGLDDCGELSTCVNTDPGFECSCPLGYELDEDNNCQNIDECAEGLDDCGASATCGDLTPGFECTCDEFTELDDANECVDINECAGDPCDPNATCTNLDAAGFECACNTGYRGDGFTCELELPCDPPCGENGVCVERSGPGLDPPGVGGAPSELVCVCEDGYIGDGFLCGNIDECSGTDTLTFSYGAGSSPDCLTQNVCLARPSDGGAFYNTLVSGDSRNARCGGSEDGPSNGNPTGTLWALGECDSAGLDFVRLTDLWGCSIGENIAGAALCMQDIESGQLVDITVLSWGVGTGSRGAFTYERTIPNPCDINAVCTDTDGGFECACNEDFEGDGIDCTFVGECDLSCAMNEECVAFDDGPSCECEAGFERSAASGMCLNINECGTTVEFVYTPGGAPDCIAPDVCLARSTSLGAALYNSQVEEPPIRARCSDSSPAGTEWARGACDTTTERFETFNDMTRCEPETITNVPVCMRVTSSGREFDITFTDWQSDLGLPGFEEGGIPLFGGFAYTRTERNPCDVNATCTDTEGSFECACNEDFDGDGFDCTFVGVCDLACGENAACVSETTGPVCACDPGYRENRVTGVCEDINECADAVTFTHPPGGEADCLSDSVCLNRSIDGGPFYNELVEGPPPSNSCFYNGPVGTQWAFGPCGSEGQRFDSLVGITDCSVGRRVVDTPMCLWLTEEDRFFDILISEWRGGGEGFPFGGWTWTRTEVSPCDLNASCTNFEGSFDCTCNEDFAGDGFACSYDGPCDLECGVGTCETDDLGPLCACPAGYEFADGTCVDINECDRQIAFSYFPGDAPDCIDDNVCFARSGDGGPIYNALVDRSAAGAECDGGFPSRTRWHAGTCDDNPLVFVSGLLNASDCSGQNIEGSSYCLELVDSGQQLDITFDQWGRRTDGERGQFSYVRDVVVPCDSVATCENRPGSYTCTCPDGYVGDGTVCTLDIACDLSCPENASCTTESGAPDCVCDAGFGDVDGACVDVDACAGTEPVSVSYTPGDEPFCLTPTVCFARATSGPIYNAIAEASSSADSPTGTLWAEGSCDDPITDFLTFPTLLPSARTLLPVRPLCLWTLDDNRYFDILFDVWGSGGDPSSDNDGVFSYTAVEAFINPCGSAGLCTDGPDGTFTCECPLGFALVDGECSDIDDCAAAPCGEGNTCVDQVGGYACVCEGQTLTYSEAPYEVSQDCITDDVCITRSDAGPIFNPLVDEDFGGGISCNSGRPTGTLWKFGPCDRFAGFTNFLGDGFADCAPPSIVGQEACLSLPWSGVRLDITFNSWGIGDEEAVTERIEPVPFGGGGTGTGGEFSYTREIVTFNEACPAIVP